MGWALDGHPQTMLFGSCGTESGFTGGAQRQDILTRAAQISLYDAVRVESALSRAWQKVRENGRKSTSEQRRVEIAEFEKGAGGYIRSLSRRLRRRTFRFPQAIGYTQPRAGKEDRPIVVANVESRIVQRSLLNVLQDYPATKTYFDTPTSYGARGVDVAIEAAYDFILQRPGYYIRSDIADFFAKIPRKIPLGVVAKLSGDDDFNELLEHAMAVDLANAETLKEKLHLFPGDDDGVAQGCALSGFLGDVLLHEFDEIMNARGIICLRYVDDFVLLGDRPARVRKAFASAQDWLGKVGLSAYDPDSSSKADQGRTDQKWEFLGCELLPGYIRPSTKSKRKLVERVDGIMQLSERVIRDPLSVRPRHTSVVETLSRASNLLRGWGNHYQFCNDELGFRKLDRTIDDRLDRYLDACGVLMHAPNDPAALDARRRVLGVHLLTDSKSDPIVARKHGTPEN